MCISIYARRRSPKPGGQDKDQSVMILISLAKHSRDSKPVGIHI